MVIAYEDRPRRPFNETGVLALDLANTWDPYVEAPERLPDARALRAFLIEYGIEERTTSAELAECRELRGSIRAIVASGSDDELAGRLDRFAAGLAVSPRVSRSPAGRWRLTFEPARKATLVERLAIRAVGELAALLQEHGAERIRTCAAEPCADAFVDTSKNGGRRYCSRRCANRRNSAIHRARRPRPTTVGGRESGGTRQTRRT